MAIDRITKALLLAIVLLLGTLCAQNLLQPARVVHGDATALQFTADKDRMYFFDSATQKVYAYASNGGHPQSALQLTKPGGELRPAPTY